MKFSLVHFHLVTARAVILLPELKRSFVFLSGHSLCMLSLTSKPWALIVTSKTEWSSLPLTGTVPGAVRTGHRDPLVTVGLGLDLAMACKSLKL